MSAPSYEEIKAAVLNDYRNELEAKVFGRQRLLPIQRENKEVARMSDDDTTIEAPKGTIFVGRKVSDGNYGSYDFGIHLPVTFDPFVPVADQEKLVLDGFEQAKQILAVQTEPVLATLVEKSFTAPKGPKAAPVSRAAVAAGAATVVQHCEACGKDTKQWDNRQKIADGQYKSTAPKFKCSVCKGGIWDTPKAVPSADEPF